MNSWLAVVFLVTAAFLGGCDGSDGTTATDPAPKGQEPESGPSALPRLLIVANPPLARAVRREWRARTGEELPIQEVDETTWRQWIAADDSLASIADAVIYPTVYLGQLAEASKILTAPGYVSAADGDERDLLANSDVLQGIREIEVRWGGNRMAFPFSSAPLLLVYRADVLRQESMDVPRTWPALHEVAAQLHQRQRAGELPDSITAIIAQPLARGWAARNLLARAASSIRDSRKYSDVFTLTSMEPRIDSAPFVQALTQLIADQQFAADPDERLTPAEVYAAVRDGSTIFGVGCWPVRLDGHENLAAAPLLGFSLLPGNQELYDDGTGGWITREQLVQAPLLSAGGFVGSVIHGTRRQRMAWNLLKQLASPEWSAAIGPAGETASPFRISQLSDPRSWLGEDLADESLVQFRDALQDYYTAPMTMTVPRIPNAQEYLDSLNEAVIAALEGKKTPQDALEHAAREWTGLLERHGRERQAEAYLRGLSIHES